MVRNCNKITSSEIPYDYLGMEFSCKNQEVDLAPVTKKAKTLNYSLNNVQLP